MSKLNLFILHGTSRQGNRSEKAAKYVKKLAEADGDFDVHFASVSELHVSDGKTDEDHKNEKYTELLNNMDAMIIVMPEYNHSMPGTLKILLDSEYPIYKKKPVSLVGVSTGRYSGVRAVDHSLPVLKELGLVVTKSSTYIGKIKESVAEDGQSADEAVTTQIESMFEELKWYGQAFKWGRENLTTEQ